VLSFQRKHRSSSAAVLTTATITVTIVITDIAARPSLTLQTLVVKEGPAKMPGLFPLIPSA
jgi:hypothetical protein